MFFEKDKATSVLFACLCAMSTDTQLIPTYQTDFFLSWEGQRSNALLWLLRLSPVSASWLEDHLINEPIKKNHFAEISHVRDLRRLFHELLANVWK